MEAKPDITLRIASMNLGGLKIRIEKKHIVELARILKREQIEILTVQEISRYPGVSTRVDFVDELSVLTDWRNAFGEMQNISGRQIGNVVFSSYPILSYRNQTFESVQPAKFETALSAAVDAGVSPITIVSAQLPSKLTADEQSQCIKILMGPVQDRAGQLIIITGNLPSSESLKNTYSLREIPLQESEANAIPRIWYSSSATIRPAASRIVETYLGKLIIAEMNVFRQKND
jgi:endonuclease/exonuclease/phosphatase family metal-dependent hydrolase